MVLSMYSAHWTETMSLAILKRAMAASKQIFSITSILILFKSLKKNQLSFG